MIETGYYTKHQDKLVRKFKKTLKRYEPRLSAQYGQTFAKTIHTDAMAYYEHWLETTLYHRGRPMCVLYEIQGSK
jgi:hypothetical protein